MHIAIDAHMVGERETGNETYMVNLARGLLRLSGRDPKGFSWDALGPPNATQDLPTTQRAQQRRFGDMPRFVFLATHPERLHAALPELAASANAQTRRLRPANALLRIPLGLPWASLAGDFDLLHVTYNAPPLNPCPTVVTVHDISFEHYPHFFSPRDRLILKTLVPLSARRAAHVLTVSQHAKQEIVARYGLSPDKISVTYEAAGEQYQPVADPARLAAVRASYGIPDGPFVLALGNLQPRKNIARLVEAFGRIVNGERLTVNGERLTVPDPGSPITDHRSRGLGTGDWGLGDRSPITDHRSPTTDHRSPITDHRPPITDHRSPFTDHRPPITDHRSPITDPGSPFTVHRSPSPPSLVIAGKAQWRESEVFAAVQRAGLAGRVLFPGYVEDADLPALYSAATVFVYPSLYEGFGLPPLEAMACGVPVISSNAASLPEVVGDAARLIDPGDTAALAQALHDVLSQPGLQAELRQRGFARAAQFSWERCAAETLAVYAAVLARRGPR